MGRAGLDSCRSGQRPSAANKLQRNDRVERAEGSRRREGRATPMSRHAGNGDPRPAEKAARPNPPRGVHAGCSARGRGAAAGGSADLARIVLQPQAILILDAVASPNGRLLPSTRKVNRRVGAGGSREKALRASAARIRRARATAHAATRCSRANAPGLATRVQRLPRRWLRLQSRCRLVSARHRYCWQRIRQALAQAVQGHRAEQPAGKQKGLQSGTRTVAAFPQVTLMLI